MKINAVIKSLDSINGNVKLTKKDLQTDKYDYTWTTDDGDDPDYIGKMDRIKVDKDEGYEVLYFIETLVNDYSELKKTHVHEIEDILQSDELSSVVMTDKLEKEIIKKLDVSIKSYGKFNKDNSSS